MEQDSVGPNHQSPIKVCVGVKFSKSSREKSMDNSMLDSKVKKDYHTFISVEDDVTLKLQPVQHLQSCNCEVCFANQGSALSRSLSRSFSMEQSSLSVSRSFTKEKSYKFSRVFTDTHKSQDLFNFVKDDVLSVLQGYNCTVFTYGPPGGNE